jgi:hypothetical protein
MRVAPIMPISVNREAEILALIEERIAMAQAELHRQFEEMIWYDDPGFGLARLLEQSANLENHIAPVESHRHGR